MPMPLHIDRDRLLSDIERLASFSDDDPPGTSRLVFDGADQKARAWLKSLCRDAGLAVREDAVGNMFARWPGARPELGAIGTGSHLDAIPHSGKFDGTVGVLGGLEAIRALQQSGFQPQRSIELLLFTAEEPTRFGLGCLGSRMLNGTLNSGADAKLKDSEGRTLAELRAAAGFHGSLNEVRLPGGYYAGFVELHIEQGPLLERERLAVGIVTSIAAPAALNAAAVRLVTWQAWAARVAASDLVLARWVQVAPRRWPSSAPPLVSAIRRSSGPAASASGTLARPGFTGLAADQLAPPSVLAATGENVRSWLGTNPVSREPAPVPVPVPVPYGAGPGAVRRVRVPASCVTRRSTREPRVCAGLS